MADSRAGPEKIPENLQFLVVPESKKVSTDKHVKDTGATQRAQWPRPEQFEQ